MEMLRSPQELRRTILYRDVAMSSDRDANVSLAEMQTLSLDTHVSLA